MDLYINPNLYYKFHDWSVKSLQAPTNRKRKMRSPQTCDSGTLSDARL